MTRLCEQQIETIIMKRKQEKMDVELSSYKEICNSFDSGRKACVLQCGKRGMESYDGRKEEKDVKYITLAKG